MKFKICLLIFTAWILLFGEAFPTIKLLSPVLNYDDWYLMVGERMTLECTEPTGSNITGNVLTMEHNGTEVSGTDKGHLVSLGINNNGEMFFRYEVSQLLWDDAGVYVCKNKISSVQFSYQIEIFSIITMNYTLMANDKDVSIHCVVQLNEFNTGGDKTASITWYRFEEPVADKEQDYEEDKTQTGTLVIHNIPQELYSKAGEYVCEVQPDTRARKLKRSVFINVPAGIRSITLSKLPTPGDDLEMLCEAYGYPKPIISWYKDGKDIKYDQRIKGVFGNSSLPDATLSFTPYNTEDDGEYTCSVSNVYSKSKYTYKLQYMAGIDTWSWLGPVLGSIIGLVLTAVLLLASLLYCYCRKGYCRHLKQETTESGGTIGNEEMTLSTIADTDKQYPPVGGADFSQQINQVLKEKGMGEVSIQCQEEGKYERLQVMKIKNEETGDTPRTRVRYAREFSFTDEVDGLCYSRTKSIEPSSEQNSEEGTPV